MFAVVKETIKLIEYLKNKLEFNAVIFLHETHCFW